MSTLPVRARIYMVAIIAAAATLLAVFAAPPHVATFPAFVALTAVAMLISLFKLRLPTTRDRAMMSASFILDFAALLLLGPHTAMLVAGVGAISQATIRVAHRKPLYRIVFNVACLVVAVQAAGAVYRLAGGGMAPFGWSRDAPAIVLAATVFFLVNSFGLACAVALSTSQPIRRVWQDSFLWAGPNYFVGAMVSTLIAEMAAREMWSWAPVAVVPAYVIYRAYRAFAGRLEDENRHRDVIESLNEGMAVVRSDGRIALWNDALERILGVPRERALDRTIAEAVPALAGTIVPLVIDAVLESGKAESIEHLAFARSDGRRILQVRVLVFANGVTLFWNDITDRAEAQAALKQSEERYALAAAASNDGLWDWDLHLSEMYCSPRWKEMLGLSPDAVCNQPALWFERVHPDDLVAFNEALNAHVAGETAHFHHEYRIRHEDGTYRHVLCRGMGVRPVNGPATRMAGSQTDVSERAAVQDQLRRAALHDALTGLPNRALFMELLGQVLDRSVRHPDQIFAVLFLDIDRFKVINDSLGHLIGDELLISVSRRLETCMREGDVIARLGGDEFTILLNDLGDAMQASVVAKRVLDALHDPFSVKGREVFVTGSIGIALSASGYKQPEHIMRDADTAMYRAKALGKARFVLFDESMHARAVDRLRLESDLRRAIERSEFVLHYQPIVALKSGRWTAFEALLRWPHPERNMSPAEFIPIVEEMGLIDTLGTWVIKEACRQVAAWRVLSPNGVLGVTVNVSARQLSHADFVFIVRDAVWAAKLRPGDLRIEITETTLMENPEAAEIVLRQLRALGVRVYLDDFGTGFSSLSYLHRFPVDTLKIDQSFIANLSSGKHQPAFIESIVALAKTLGTQVVAEGVETKAQMDALVRIGCAEAQGFFFAKPLTPETVQAFIAEREPGAAFVVASPSSPRVAVAASLIH
jgi:diguanylate cyclase (GGDEF)-like protein/PAS domain S-box-containing protein